MEGEIIISTIIIELLIQLLTLLLRPSQPLPLHSQLRIIFQHIFNIIITSIWCNNNNSFTSNNNNAYLYYHYYCLHYLCSLLNRPLLPPHHALLHVPVCRVLISAVVAVVLVIAGLEIVGMMIASLVISVAATLVNLAWIWVCGALEAPLEALLETSTLETSTSITTQPATRRPHGNVQQSPERLLHKSNLQSILSETQLLSSNTNQSTTQSEILVQEQSIHAIEDKKEEIHCIELDTQKESKKEIVKQTEIKRVRDPHHRTLIASEDYTISIPSLQAGQLLYAIENNESDLFFNHFITKKTIQGMTGLSNDSMKILNLPNAGGTSVESEVLSYEVLHRCFGAQLLRTEMEIQYFPEGSKKTDYSVLLFGKPIGISVTRAMKFNGTFTEEDAIHLLEKKLLGIILSSENVYEEHGWEKQILHVWATHNYIADIIAEQFQKMSASLRLNTIMIITVSDHRSKAANIFTQNHAALDAIFHPDPLEIKNIA